MIFIDRPITLEITATITVKPSDMTFTPDPPPVTEPPVEPDPPVDPEPPVTEPEPPVVEPPVTEPEPPVVEPPSEPTGGLALDYVGACRVRKDTAGDSRPAFSSGAICVTDDGLWIAGHSHHKAVGQYALPDAWAATTAVAEMPIVSNVRPFAIISPEPFNDGNGFGVTGMIESGADLIVSVAAYYDAAGDSVQNMSVLHADNTQSGYFHVQGEAKAAGWMLETPAEYVAQVGSHYMGFASNIPINFRLSIGPSLFGWDGIAQSVVTTNELMCFPLSNPMGSYDSEPAPADPLWNELSIAACGFIHGDDYIVVGRTGGLTSGIGYKIEQWGNPGRETPGSAPYDPADWYNYYWKFRMADILSAENPHDPRPYDFGVLEGVHGDIGGASYKDGYLYIMDTKGDALQSQYELQPVIYKYRVL